MTLETEYPTLNSRSFTRATRSALLAAILTVVAMVLYPGGTPIDRTTHGYSLTQNFLSDLGMLAAYDGGSNRIGAALFVTSLAALLVGFGGALISFISLYSTTRPSRAFARAALVVGAIVCAAFVGVALTPEDRMMSMHIRFTLFAFRAFPVATLLLALAAHASGARPRVTATWAALTAVLIAYVGLLGWGPGLDTPPRLAVYVIAQKVVSITAVLAIIYLAETTLTRRDERQLGV